MNIKDLIDYLKDRNCILMCKCGKVFLSGEDSCCGSGKCLLSLSDENTGCCPDCQTLVLDMRLYIAGSRIGDI